MRSEVSWPTIPAMARERARRSAGEEAVVDGDRRVDFETLGARVDDAARALLASGVERGDRVAIWAPNSLEWIVAALGVTTAGGVLVPVNTRFRGAGAARPVPGHGGNGRPGDVAAHGSPRAVGGE